MTPIPDHIRLVAAQDWVERVTADEEWDDDAYAEWEREQTGNAYLMCSAICLGACALLLLAMVIAWGIVEL